ncbi:MAG: DUF6655 family protein [Phycisphaeraceae bacterium]
MAIFSTPKMCFDRIGVFAVCLLLLIGLSACTTVRTTDPPQTATEQFLLSRAAERAVDQISADALRGRRVFVDDTYFPSSQQYMLAEIRAKLLQDGIRMTRVRDEAQIVVEVRTAGIGIDRYEFLLGVPAFALGAAAGATGTGTGDTAITTPELALIKNTRQWGAASVAMVAYWSDTGEVVATSGPFIGRSFREDWWFFGAGPRSIGNIPVLEPPE